MKKLICLFLTLCLSLTAAGMLSGCFFGGKDDAVVEISTAAQLTEMVEGKSYKLTADVDLDGASWTPVKVKNFDGDGHTISNALIVRVGDEKTQAQHGFFIGATEIKNLTLTDITYSVTLNKDHNTFGILVGRVTTLENVTVKDCKGEIFSTYQEHQVVATNDTYFSGGVLAGYACNVKDCSAIDCELTYSRTVVSNSSDAFFGGLVGTLSSQETASGNFTKNAKLTWETKSGEFVFCGGLAGKVIGGLTDSYATGAEINVIANADDKFVRVGGVAGYISNKELSVSNCASVNNKITVSNAGGYNVGGFAGFAESSIKNCLSQGNTLKAETKINDDSLYCGLAGFAACIKEKTVSRCVSQYNVIDATSPSANNSTFNRIFEAGFTARAISAVVKCASYENQILGGMYKDGFARQSDVLTDCYLKCVSGATENANGLPEPTEWEDSIELLDLDGELWQISEVDEKQQLVLKLTAGI